VVEYQHLTTLASRPMFSKFGSGSVRPCQIFGTWLTAVRFGPNFENINSDEYPKPFEGTVRTPGPQPLLRDVDIAPKPRIRNPENPQANLPTYFNPTACRSYLDIRLFDFVGPHDVGVPTRMLGHKPRLKPNGTLLRRMRCYVVLLCSV